MAGKSEIVERIAVEVEGITKAQASEVFDAILQAVARRLKRGEKVTLTGFGSFSISRRAARTGRNPSTGESIQIRAGKTVRFRQGRRLKDTLEARRLDIDGDPTTPYP